MMLVMTRMPLHEVDGLAAHGLDHLVDHAAHVAGDRRLQKHLHQAREDDPREEVGQVDAGLHDAL